MSLRDSREEWLKEREKGIGGSEASAILGCNPYMSNVELWEYKTGRKQREDKDSQYMKYGREAERALIELFGLDYPEEEVITATPYSIEKNKEYPYILGTLDARLENKKTKKKGFLEVKTSNIMASSQKEKWNDRIPHNYYVQCLHYLLVNEAYEYFYLKAQLKSKWDRQTHLTTKHYYFERVEIEEDLKYLKEKEIKFWEDNVKKDIRPNLELPPI
jgi:putative phage-type endonuclease